MYISDVQYEIFSTLRITIITHKIHHNIIITICVYVTMEPQNTKLEYEV